MASELRVNTLKDASGNNSIATSFVAQTPKGWSRIPDTHDSLTDSFNASSITDGGTGTGTINLTSSMSDANYCGTTAGGHVGSGDTTKKTYVKDMTSSTYIVFAGITTSNSQSDFGGSYSILGDLA